MKVCEGEKETRATCSNCFRYLQVKRITEIQCDGRNRNDKKSPYKRLSQIIINNLT